MSHESGRYEYRVVNASDGASPSVAIATLDDAKEAAVRRYCMYPADGPQKVQRRFIGDWEDQ